MERDAILERVLNVVSETLDIDVATLAEKSTFKDLGADSFDLLELITALEDEFGQTLDDEVLADIATVGEAVDAIEKVC